MAARNKPTSTVFFLRFSDADGKDFREEFLLAGQPEFFFRPRMTLDENASFSQDDIDGAFERGDMHMKMVCFVTDDVFVAASRIRKWAKDPRGEFPIKFDFADCDERPFVVRTRFEIEFLKHVDRDWYVERAVVFRLAMVSRVEQMASEAKYWESVGDLERAAIRHEMIADERSNTNAAVGSDS